MLFSRCYNALAVWFYLLFEAWAKIHAYLMDYLGRLSGLSQACYRCGSKCSHCLSILLEHIYVDVDVIGEFLMSLWYRVLSTDFCISPLFLGHLCFAKSTRQ